MSNDSFDFSQEVLFQTFECNTESLLQALSRSISDIYVPYFQTSDLNLDSNDSNNTNVNLISYLNNFVDILNNAQESINERILLKPCDKIDLTQMQNASDYVSIASNSESLVFIEETMKIWIRQMEEVKANHLNLIKQSNRTFFVVLFSKGYSRK